jgi:hypothetical protein
MNKRFLWGFVLVSLALVGVIEGIRLNHSEPVETAPMLVLSDLQRCHLMVQYSLKKQGAKFFPRTCRQARDIYATSHMAIPLMLAATEIEYDQGKVVTIRGQTSEGRWYQVDTRDGRNLKVVPVTR